MTVGNKQFHLGKCQGENENELKDPTQQQIHW